MTTGDMQQIGAEVDNILKQMVVTGNASLRGQRLFAGEQIDADPFTLSGSRRATPTPATPARCGGSTTSTPS